MVYIIRTTAHLYVNMHSCDHPRLTRFALVVPCFLALLTVVNYGFSISVIRSISSIEKSSPYKIDFNNDVDDADVAMNILATTRALEESSLRFYMYDHPNITLKNAAIKKHDHKWNRYGNEAAYDANTIKALEESPLRTLDPNEADLFIPPIPFGSLVTSKDGTDLINLVYETLVNHPVFRKHHGDKHILVATPYILFRSDKYSYVGGMVKWYRNLMIQNMSVAMSWDPNAVINALQEGIDFHEYTAEFKKLKALSRRSFSLGLGSSSDLPNPDLHLATMEKFHNSSNLVFYQTRTKGSMYNSTIFRHAPVTNITLAGGGGNGGDHNLNFPKSSIGFGIDDIDAWKNEYANSKFCLVIRGDSPHSKAFWRSVRAGCIPVVVADALPIYSPILKSTLNMSDYAVILGEEDFVRDVKKALLKLQEMSDVEVEGKLQHLAFAQRVMMHDHPHSLFVPAFLREGVLATYVH